MVLTAGNNDEGKLVTPEGGEKLAHQDGVLAGAPAASDAASAGALAAARDDAPADVPAGTPANAPADVPAGAPADAPAEASADIPAGALAGAPADARAGAPVVLEARNLTLAWEDADPVAVGINLVVREGEIVCLVGKSGMGKTTILHALAGLTMPREGRVLLHGRDVTGQPGSISYMLQKDLLLPSLTVIDNACLPLTLSGMSKAEARRKAQPLIERFGLQEAAGKWPSQLSGGMRQRAAFLRTYLMGNDVVMLDEPFSALDAITRVDLRSWFAEEARSLGLSTLMITHDADEACTLADRVYVLGCRSAADGDADGRSPESEQGIAGEAGGQRGAAERIAAGEQGVADEGPVAAAAQPVVGKRAPATIVGEVVLMRPNGASDVDFALTPEFLEAKARLLALL